MNLESEIEISRPRHEVFDYLAHGEYLPEYAADFTSVEQTSGGEPGPGTQYAYRMKRGTEGTFRRTVYEPHSKLAWQGPPAKSGPGTMAPSGSWELSDTKGGTLVKLVMSPTPGGLLRLLAPIISKNIANELPTALVRLKERLEQLSQRTDNRAPPAAPRP